MGATEWLALLGGVAAIAWVNWYFFLAESSGMSVAAVAGGGAGASEVRIEVRGGYTPSTVRVPSGRPVRLVFDRQETSGCSEEVVIPDFGVRRFLPANEETVVEIRPEAPGVYEFTCGMGMLRGRIVAE
jgi:plastocyanin domain-containing protein